MVFGRVGLMQSTTKVEGDRITVTFNNVAYGIFSKSHCNVTFIFEGKNTGVVKRYELAQGIPAGAEQRGHGLLVPSLTPWLLDKNDSACVHV